MVKKFILSKTKKILNLIIEIFFYNKKISEPLKEDPNDLVNIHNPTIKEYAINYFDGEKRKIIYDWWYSAILKDEEGTLYFFIISFHPNWSYYRFTRICKDKKPVPETIISKYPFIGGKFNAIGYSERDETIDLWVPKNIRLQSLKKPYARCVIKAGESRLILDTNDLTLNVNFSSLGTPFWINKGREATCSSRGDAMSGFYDISNVEGSLLYNAHRIQLTGVGINEHLMAFFPPKRYWKRVDGIFFCTDQMYCAFIYLENDIGIRRREYKDGAIVIRETNEYLIPTDFKIEYLKYDDIKKMPVKIRIVADTKKGQLNVVAKVIGEIERQLALKVLDAKFDFDNGRELRLTNGYGQHALY